MCGIICGIGADDILPKVLSGLKRLEYRGYDSAGVSTIDASGVTTRKSVGKVSKLISCCEDLSGKMAIAHTRWATHGVASELNAHPHTHQNSAWVHNGIINNHSALRKDLEAKGYHFKSETDSEVLGILFEHLAAEETDPLKVLQKCYQMLDGSFAWALISAKFPERIFFATKQSPMVLGVNSEYSFIASDPLALIDYCSGFFSIPSGSIGYCSLAEQKVLNANTLIEIDINQQPLAFKQELEANRKFKHYMHQEIHAQPSTLKRSIEYYWQANGPSSNLQAALAQIPDDISMLQFIGCGSSHYASMIGKYWFNKLSNYLVDCEIASEFRYLDPKNICPSILIALSQSGETADTLAAFLHETSNIYARKATLCNVPHSSLARASDIVLPILAGQEIGVASTKAFTNQLVILLMLALAQKPEHPLANTITQIPQLVLETLKLEEQIAKIAGLLCHEQKMLFLGRGIMYPVALEGALKLKELSYIHAHAYPAGELKHGPLALIDNQLVTIALLTNCNQRAKTIANLREIQARHGRLVLFYEGNTEDLSHLNLEHAIAIPSIEPLLSPITFTIALQLLAYHIANDLGCDVDQPRNLAKSVTVE